MDKEKIKELKREINKYYPTENVTDVVAFELESEPRTLQIPTSLIHDFESYSAPFTNMRASALLSSMGCDEDNYINYSDEELTIVLIWALQDEIKVSQSARPIIEDFFRKNP